MGATQAKKGSQVEIENQGSSSDFEDTESEEASKELKENIAETPHVDTPRVDPTIIKADAEPENPKQPTTVQKTSMWGSFWKTVVDITTNPEKLID